ncbi:MAG: hypothetical protein U0166_15310 [Acidobacteriota bacterium]
MKRPIDVRPVAVTLALALAIAMPGRGAPPPTWRELPMHNWPGPGATYWIHGAGGEMLVVNTERCKTWQWTGTRWVEQAPPPFSRRYVSSVAYDSARGTTVLFGGWNDSVDFNETWEFDGTTWTQKATPAQLTPRRDCVMAYDSVRQKIVLYGGGDRNGTQYDETWEYDGTSWTQVGVPAPLPQKVPSAHMAFFPDRGKCVLMGGAVFGSPLAEVWEFDGATWTQLPDAPFARRSGAMAYDPVRRGLVIFGGWAAGGAAAPVADPWFMSSAGTWTRMPAPVPTEERTRPCMDYDAGRQAMVLYGGEESSTWTSGSVWELDAAGWRKTSPTLPLIERDALAAAYDSARDRVVVFGGEHGRTNNPVVRRNDTWEYDGFQWVAGGAPPAALTPRSGTAMAYDAARGTIVMFGGSRPPGGSTLDETWEYDGTWTQAMPPGKPPSRAFAALAFDAARGRVVLCGGCGAATYNDTWTFDGTTWADVTPGTNPPPRCSHGMAYDATRQVTVLFGGFGSTQAFDDTWEWNGSQWTQGPAAPTSLTRRGGFSMAYDEARGVSVVTGGVTGAGFRLGETWAYNGTAWTQESDLPQTRWRSAMAYDGRRDRMILFGGYEGLNDDWISMRTLEYRRSSAVEIVAGEGHGPANANRVRVHDATGTFANVDFLAYGAGQQGVNVTSTELDGAPGGEIVTGPGPGPVYGPQVRGFRNDGTAMGKVNYYAYGTLKFGVNVGAGELDRDAYDEILTGAGPGDVFGPHVRGWNFDAAAIASMGKVSFFAYSTLKYGVVVASGDIDSDGYAEILTAPGPGTIFGAQVRGFNYDNATLQGMSKINFNAFTTSYGSQVRAGDVDADTWEEIVASPGPGGAAGYAPRFLGFDFDLGTIAPLPGFDVTLPVASTYGGRMGLGELAPDARDQLIAGHGPDPTAPATVQVYRYFSTSLTPGVSFAPFTTTYGVELAGGTLGY